MTDLVIKNARVMDPESGRDEIADIAIQNGVITDIAHDLDGAEIIDAHGLIAAPGLIDMRVSTGEPGTENRETIVSAAAAAASGGVTTIIVTPNTDPVIDDMSLIDFIQGRALETDINVYVSGALTKNLDGETMTEIGLMSEAGAVMFSNGDMPVSDALIMRRLLAYSARYNALISTRPFDQNLSKGACAHESDFTARLGLIGEPSASERITIDRDAALTELTGGRLLIDMISSREGVETVRRARKRDIDLSCSVSINHLALNEMDIGDYRTFAKLNPPLRGGSTGPFRSRK